MGNFMSVLSRFGELFGVIKPRNKFDPLPGITLYDNSQSPCAQRVRIALLEKGIPFRKVEVDLLAGENLTDDYKRICPNKKVPAIAFVGVQGVPDCVLFESNVITEFLDSDWFPGRKLYPTDPWQRAQVKMWQDWELGLVDDFVPLMYGNLMPFVLQLKYGTKDKFLKTLPPNILPAKREYWTKTFDAELSTTSELVQYCEVCYRQLTHLEKALRGGRQFLVGDNFTSADMSVIPRIAMFDMVGAAIIPSSFPQVHAYLKRLGSRPSFRKSQTLMTRVLKWMVLNMESWIVRLGNWRSGRDLQRLDGSLFIERALQRSSKAATDWSKQKDRAKPGTVLVTEHLCCPEWWQVKLLLELKEVKYQTVHHVPEDAIGSWSGSGGLMRIYHDGLEIVGIRAVLDYIDSTFSPDKAYLPHDPLKRAQTQCWQAWDQTMGYLEVGPLLEINLVSKFLVAEHGDSNFQKRLDSLKTNPRYQARHFAILRSFFCGLNPDKPEHQPMIEWFTRNRSEVVAKAAEVKNGQKGKMEMINDRLTHLDHHLMFEALNAQMEDAERFDSQERRGSGDADSRSYLVGGQLSLADIILFCRLTFLQGLQLVDSDKFPHVAEWYQNLQDTQPKFTSFTKDVANALSF